MRQTEAEFRVLVVSSSQKVVDYLAALLAGPPFVAAGRAASAGEARRALVDAAYDLVLINTPLPDEFGSQLAVDVAQQYPAVGVVLFTSAEAYEQVTAGVEGAGVLTLARPGTHQSIYQAVRLAAAACQKVRVVAARAQSLEEKMAEIRVVNRAKWLLVEQLHMTEPEAHRYIEKTAMDRCVKRREIAEGIIQTYGK